MLIFSPPSSLFDLATFAALWWALGTDSPGERAAFQAGWFTEGLLSQVLIVLVLRTRQMEIPPVCGVPAGRGRRRDCAGGGRGCALLPVAGFGPARVVIVTVHTGG
ncbi:hypothetical protein DMH04_24035 [Kibdelosporangium aridum]|uniref:Uncharacterized protein n=1 Tax=Kibdelosporangium aridum TaxID=2030 RepID=A0A428Z6Z2_KIBAR|nr:hypothetical protein [Kibdelosporangium aridum]RSM83203.1 hypothetical protein DMH04_24035 [Kibdelosporangium aridum]